MKKKQVNKLQKSESELDIREDKKYEIKVIKDSIVYVINAMVR